MIDIRILQNIGLSETEAKIYISLLEKGSQNISDISDISGCNRVQIYGALPRLKEQKLVGETIKWKRKYFFAENPENLENIFYEQKLSFQNTVSLLKEKYEKKITKPELKTFYTSKWIHYIFEDIVNSLEVGDVFYRYSGRKPDSFKEFLPKSYREKRDKKKLERMVITNDSLKNKKKKRLEREIVSIPKKYDLFEDNVSKIIYGNKVAIIDYNSETSFIVENEKFARFEEKIFKLLFKYLRKK